MAWDTSSVTIGRSTKKADYDRLRMNDQALASGTFTFYGAKTWKAAQVYDAAVKFNAGVTGTCTFRGKTTLSATCVYFAPITAEPSIGTLHLITTRSATIPYWKVTTLRSATCSSFTPGGAKAIQILYTYNIVSGGDNITFGFYSDSSGTLWQGGSHFIAAYGNEYFKPAILKIDSARKFYYKKTNSSFSATITFYYIGYYM